MTSTRSADAPPADPFGTASLRSAVLAAWSASPDRFREDANAEEWLSIGYGGRVIAELAANAADAAQSAGAPGRLAVGLQDNVLRVANTGSPLRSADVAALASLRASAKRSDHRSHTDQPGVIDDGPRAGDDDAAGSVGHFGVGFTAVRAVSDEIVVASTTGSIRFSTAETETALRSIAGSALRDELSRRHGHVPALRLPWPVLDARPPDGYATEIRLTLRGDAERASVEELLGLSTSPSDDHGPVHLATDLLWALPGLTEIALPTVTVRRVDPEDESGIVEIRSENQHEHTAQRFRVHRASGELPAEVLSDRPVEERSRTAWFVTWIVEAAPDGEVIPIDESAVGAPTATEDRIGVPARLVASLPVDDVRSRVAAGPLTRFMLSRAADAYADLLRTLPIEDRIALLPRPGFPLGEVDARLRELLHDRLCREQLLLDGCGRPVAPRDAVMVPALRGPAAAAVAEAVPGLIAWPTSPAAAEALRGLGVRVGSVGEALDAVAAVERRAEFYRPIYDALLQFPADELAALPVPRSGGGTLIGARKVLISGERGSAAAATAARLVPGLRLAAPGMRHPLLFRLGARELDAETLLAAPELAREIERRYEDFDEGHPTADDDGEADREFADAVLDLVAECGSLPPATAAAFGHLILTDDEGRPSPASELLLPNAPLRAVLADDVALPQVESRWLDRHGPGVLERVGVRSGFAVVRHRLPPGDDAELHDVDAWWDEAAAHAGPATGAGSAGEEPEVFTAIADLDLVDDDAWPRALSMMASDPAAREALRPTAWGPSYSSWWLQRHARLSGEAPRRWRTSDATDLVGLYDCVPDVSVAALDVELHIAIGLRRSLADAALDPADFLTRWADPHRQVAAVRVPAVTAAVIAALEHIDLDALILPATVRTLAGSVVDADDAAVLDHPALAQVLPAGSLVAGGRDAARVGDILDLALASEKWSWTVVADGPVTTTLGHVPGVAAALEWLGGDMWAGRSVTVARNVTVGRVEHDSSTSPTGQSVAWWVGSDGSLVVDGSAGGLSRLVAHLAGRWPDRFLIESLIAGRPGIVAEMGIDGSAPCP